MKPGTSDIQRDKERELREGELQVRELKKSIDNIYRVFKVDANYDNMVHTENQTKADKLTLRSLNNENVNIRKILDK